ncbi:MAG: hypothetical protein F4X63_03145 [Nitrospira sp. SB0662_bin_26]|nr:hypothetical protein [Nitrospira sp. SB0662_bin_26]
MSETSFALADNRLPDLSHYNENSLAYDPFNYRSRKYRIRKAYAERFAVTQQQSQDACDTESTETRIADLRTLNVISPDIDEIVADIESIISLPKLSQVSQAQATFHALQEWEGYVLKRGERDFTARLLDLTAGSTQEEEEVTIPLAEISEDDLNRLRQGSVFRWVIGYERSVSKAKRRISQIVFRDLPAMTMQDLSEGEKWAKKIGRSIAG